jgi:hypothetical protein
MIIFLLFRRGKKISKSTLEILRKHNEELIKKENEKETEQKRVPERKPEKVEKPKKTKEVMIISSFASGCG